MPYVGNQPAANFASVTKDTFNGGDTSGASSVSEYTLSKPATTNGVAVYVENVRQIPTTAYTVSGTTLTFTGTTPSGTNNVYVLHHNAVASTANHPAGQDLTASNATLTGDVTIGSGTAADRKIVFDCNAQDYHVGLDDSVDKLIIGKGSALGTTSHIVTDANGCSDNISVTIIEPNEKFEANVITTNYGALYETCSEWPVYVQYDNNRKNLSTCFAYAIDEVREYLHTDRCQEYLQKQQD